jgi:hypothetical protein
VFLSVCQSYPAIELPAGKAILFGRAEVDDLGGRRTWLDVRCLAGRDDLGESAGAHRGVAVVYRQPGAMLVVEIDAIRALRSQHHRRVGGIHAKHLRRLAIPTRPFGDQRAAPQTDDRVAGSGTRQGHDIDGREVVQPDSGPIAEGQFDAALLVRPQAVASVQRQVDQSRRSLGSLGTLHGNGAFEVPHAYRDRIGPFLCMRRCREG